MPSILPNFEYDIFISYRHNDNRSGWVTEFVDNLREELATIIKEPVSVYFDSNLYDGLLETHHVDKSLEGKLRSLIFIPVLSQIYCDQKSFAWQHEFCAFNRIASGGAGQSPRQLAGLGGVGGSLGREITLRSGNVASRILPVVIHNLEQEDLELIESEIKTKLRSIDFTFRSPGVNRPLRKEDKRNENVNNLSYHDQLNKLANAVKEILMSIKNPGKVVTTSNDVLSITENPAKAENKAIEKSIAVLPFQNLSQDPAQEYFADGITENILTVLTGVKELRVISRTSVMRYKKTSKSLPEIAEELKVKYIIEGSAQTHKEKVRISVQLINALEDQPIWSKVFVESLDDIFTIQNNVAEIVARELHTSLLPKQAKTANEVPTQNREAYDLFLKGRHAYNQWGVEGYKASTEYYKKAIGLDPEFREAYSYLASSYSARMSWNGDLSPAEALKNIEPNLAEAMKRGASDNDYVTKAFIEFFIQKNFSAAEKNLKSAIELNGNNSLAYYTLCYVLNMAGRFDEATLALDAAKKIDPLTAGYFNYHVLSLYLQSKFEEAESTLHEALRLFPNVIRFHDNFGRLYLTMGKYAEARDAILTGLKITTLRPPSMVAYLAIAYTRLNEKNQAKELLQELTKRSHAGEKGVNVYLVHVSYALGDVASARHWYVEAKKTNDVDLVWWNVDPLLKNFREELSKTTSVDFESAENYLIPWLEKEMPKHEYHNFNHIQDVLQASMLIAASEKINEHEIKLLRIAALLHDVGFIHSPKDHEAKGVAMAREILPAYGFGESELNIITNMILATKLPQSPTTQLERILCDADLDYLGRDDFKEISTKLFNEMLAAGVVETEREWNLVQRTFLQSHKYHTEFGKQNREEQKQERLREIAEGLVKR